MEGNTASTPSTDARTYLLIDKFHKKQASFYRLKQTDGEGNNNYGKVIAIKTCGVNNANSLIVFPNPSCGKFDLLFTPNPEQIHSIKIFNCSAQKIYEITGVQSSIDLSGNKPGIYFIHVQLSSQAITVPIVVEK